MISKVLLSLLLIWLTILTSCISSEPVDIDSPNYPKFGDEKSVNIIGLSFDAMEPFISADGIYLFFNNLNDGINTAIFYAVRVNDSTFELKGALNGTNQTTPPYLDGVPDMDADQHFYWTSTREYPEKLNNLFYGKFHEGSVVNIGRVQGDFYKATVGWLLMDHSISSDGQYLYYNNARFDNINCIGVCETTLGIAKKENDSTFIKISNSNAILQRVINDDYNYYAPCISSDDLELYFTRYLKEQITRETRFEICVSVRDNPSDEFSDPKVLFSEVIGNLIEAPTLTSDKKIIYYHRKIDNTHKIKMRYRL